VLGVGFYSRARARRARTDGGFGQLVGEGCHSRAARADIVGLASAEEGLRARALGLGWSGGQRFLGGNVTGIDQGFSPMVVETCMGERDRARVLGLACVREIRGTKERGMSSRF
jgi:hypothetical protein